MNWGALAFAVFYWSLVVAILKINPPERIEPGPEPPEFTRIGNSLRRIDNEHPEQDHE